MPVYVPAKFHFFSNFFGTADLVQYSITSGAQRSRESPMRISQSAESAILKARTTPSIIYRTKILGTDLM